MTPDPKKHEVCGKGAFYKGKWEGREVLQLRS